jgi:methylated-DNA-[protein]-cysteine S-methyltransferase
VQDADRIGSVSFALFDTALGRCALVWRGGSVIGFALPAPATPSTSAHLKRRHADASPAEPPPTIATAIAGVQRLLAGEPADLSNTPVDLAGVPPFEQRIYALLREVGPGATITYGELAERAGSPGAARAVGAAMVGTQCRSSSRATACSPEAVGAAAFPRRAGCPPSSGCCRSSGPAAAAARCCLTTFRWP